MQNDDEEGKRERKIHLYILSFISREEENDDSVSGWRRIFSMKKPVRKEEEKISDSMYHHQREELY